MKCPKCDHENPSSAKFCRNCGAKLPSVCPECGKPVNSEDRFCMECGARLPETEPTKPGVAVPRLEDMHSQLQSLIPEELAQKYATAEPQAAGENRPVTALFADISGFTPLSSTQSSETILQLVQDCFRQLVGIVARYEGIISGFRGDGLLALFGAPILHENDAERAIRAAMDMLNAMHDRQLEVTIGINTAPMTVGEIQTQLHREYTAYGTDVILASRLQDAAQPGQILAGTGTHRLTRRAFDFGVVHDLELQGFPQPVTAYAVQQVKVHPEKLRGIEGLRARMIGREHEFAELKESADQWLGGQGQLVSVIGEAGIGKSRLVSELRQYLDTRQLSPSPPLPHSPAPSLPCPPAPCLEGRCVSIGQPISYWPFIDILRTHFGFRENDDTPAIARKVTESITSLMPQGAEETLPLLGNLLSIKYGNELDDRLKFASPEQIRHQTLMRLRDIFETLARQRPLMLILEDLHWSDDLSLDLVSLLMDELANTPIMLLCVYRPEKEHRVWQLGDQARRKCLDRYTEIRLNPLSSLQSRQLVESLLEIENLPEATKEVILTRSEGNPFFIEEVIRSLIEQDMVYQDGDHWKARDEIASISVPDTIQSVVLARVDRLQAEAKYVLQCASVIGRLFRYRLLQHISRQERDLDSYLAEFEEKELVYEERTVPELEYAFKHAFTQEATYEGILERSRKEFHLQVAVGIERLYQERLDEYYEDLAHHYSRSGNAEKAVEYLIKAGEKAKRNYVNETALDYYQKALDIAETKAEREVVLKHRAKLLIDLYRGKEALKDYEILMEHAKLDRDSHKELFALVGIAHSYCIISLDDAEFAQKSYELCLQAYKMASELNDKEGIVRSLTTMLNFCSNFGLLTIEEFKVYKKIAFDTAVETGDDELILEARMFGGVAPHLSVVSNETMEELAEFLRQRNDLVRLKEVLFSLTEDNIGIGNFRKTIDLANATINIASEISSPPVMYPTLKAYALIRLGDYKSAWKSLQEEVAGPSHKLGQMMKDFGMGVFYMEMSDQEKAKEILEIVVQQSIELKRAWMERVVRFQLASAIVDAIKYGESDISELDQIVLPELGIPYHLMCPPRVVKGEIEMLQGNLDEAFKLSEQGYTEVDQFDGRYFKVSHIELSARILLKMGRFDEVLTRIDEGVRISEEMGYLPMLWRLHATKAQALEALGRSNESKDEYEGSAEIIKRLADSIQDKGFERSFMSNPLVTMILNESKERGQL